LRKTISLLLVVLTTTAATVVVGCSQPDNPKMPDIAPTAVKPDTTVPAKSGPGGTVPYGSSKKYQDLMNK
jgi:hypothetical protein